MPEMIEYLKKKFDTKMQIDVDNQLEHILVTAKSGNQLDFVCELLDIYFQRTPMNKWGPSSILFIFPKTLTLSERHNIHELSEVQIFETLTQDEKLHLFIKYPIQW